MQENQYISVTMHPLILLKNTRKFFQYFFLVVALPLSSQNKNIDSLTRLISKLSSEKSTIATDTSLGKSYYQLCREYIYVSSHNKADSIAHLSLRFAEKKINEYKGSTRLFFKKHQALYFNALGIVQSSTGNQTKALEYFGESLKISQALNDKKGISSSLGSMGNAFKDQGIYSRALESYFGALKYAEELKLDKISAIHYANIGNAYHDLGDNTKALEYYFKALNLAEKLGDKRGVAIDLGNIGRAYMYANNYNEALEFYFRSLKMAEELELKLHVSHTLANIGSLYFKKKDYPKAIEFMQKALEKAEEINDNNEIARILGGMGKVYMEQNQPEKAEPLLKKALQMSFDVNDLNLIQSHHNSLSKLYAMKKDWKNAFEHHRLFLSARDSLFNKENTQKAMRSELNFEYEKKATADSVKHLSEQKIKDAEIAVQHEQLKQARLRSYALFGGLALVLIFTAFVVNRFRVTHKQKLIIEQKEKETKIQKEIIEEKHREITDSINYAERIQRAFLATEQLLNDNLNINRNSEKNYFVIFKPKDIVSGDFYWASELPNGDFAMATADSTGHGVPGAIMSLLNITSLEKAVERYTDPAEILNATRKTIIERLKKDGSAEGGKDGMDCSLLCFDFKSMTLKIATANNPVYIVRNLDTDMNSFLQEAQGISILKYEQNNSSVDKILIEIKPDKIPVGKHDKDHQSFTTHSVKLKRGDMIYTLTDGFSDQFGGESGKKFMNKKLKDVLVSNSHLPVAEQKRHLEQTFANWIGKLEQVDDVTVIGISV